MDDPFAELGRRAWDLVRHEYTTAAAMAQGDVANVNQVRPEQ